MRKFEALRIRKRYRAIGCSLVVFMFIIGTLLWAGLIKLILL